MLGKKRKKKKKKRNSGTVPPKDCCGRLLSPCLAAYLGMNVEMAGIGSNDSGLELDPILLGLSKLGGPITNKRF